MPIASGLRNTSLSQGGATAGSKRSPSSASMPGSIGTSRRPLARHRAEVAVVARGPAGVRAVGDPEVAVLRAPARPSRVDRDQAEDLLAADVGEAAGLVVVAPVRAGAGRDDAVRADPHLVGLPVVLVEAEPVQRAGRGVRVVEPVLQVEVPGRGAGAVGVRPAARRRRDSRRRGRRSSRARPRRTRRARRGRSCRRSCARGIRVGRPAARRSRRPRSGPRARAASRAGPVRARTPSRARPRAGSQSPEPRPRRRGARRRRDRSVHPPRRSA